MKRISMILLSLSCLQITQAQEPEKAPKVVVGITVDQLRTDYLNYFWGAFGDRGFKRLYKDGVLFTNVTYGFPNVDKASSVASLQTGTYPFIHGIAASSMYDKVKQRMVTALEDPAYMGNATAETVSPAALQTSTIGDELKIATDGAAKVFAVAPDLQQALLSGGHMSDGTVWLDDVSGKWATTTYYQNYPWYIDNYNQLNPLEKRMEDLSWLPVHEAKAKFQIPFMKKDFPFMHTFSKEDRLHEIALFKTSGLINGEVNEVVYTILKNGALGKFEEYPDLLNITYYAGNYQNKSAKEFSLEIKDTYVRLDSELGNLLDSLDKHIGLNRTLIYITSTGYNNMEDVDPERFKFSGGDFFPKRCVALLGMYLTAMYGNGNWVDGYYNDQIYLNRKLIEEKKLSLDEVQRRSAEMVIQLSGVNDVVTASNLLHGYFNGEVMDARNGYSKKSSGDLLLKLQPGWTVRIEDPQRPDYTIRSGDINFPLLFFGFDLKPAKHSRPAKIAEVAPTVAAYLHIRSPNGAKEKPMVELISHGR